MIYADRFLIGGLISLSAVAFYTAPFDMLTRFWRIPGALTNVLFPAFASTLKHEPERAGFLFTRGIKYLLMIMFPLVLVTVTLSPEILRVWLGKTFESNSTEVLRWLAVGVLLNALAQVPFALIQSAGKPEITFAILAVEFPFYWVAVWILTVHFGIGGTAIAWTARAACELVFFSLYSFRLLPQPPHVGARLLAASSGGLVLLYTGSTFRSGSTKALFLVATLVAFVLTCWRWLRSTERVFLSSGFDRTLLRVRVR